TNFCVKNASRSNGHVLLKRSVVPTGTPEFTVRWPLLIVGGLFDREVGMRVGRQICLSRNFFKCVCLSVDHPNSGQFLSSQDQAQRQRSDNKQCHNCFHDAESRTENALRQDKER